MHAYCQPVTAADGLPCCIVPTDADRSQQRGRRFITGTAVRIPPRISLQRQIFCPRLHQRETFTPFHVTANSEKESRSQNSAPTAACGVVSVCAAKIYRKANCTPSTALEIHCVTSPRLLHLRCLIASWSLYCSPMKI